MAMKCNGDKFSVWTLFWAATLVMLNCLCVNGRKISNEKYLTIKHKGTIKTIKSIEDGDVIDCVDIHKQPAFDHPLINDLQIEPASDSSGLKDTKSAIDFELFQAWRKNGECPEETVPIRRSQKLHLNHTFSFGDQKQQSSHELILFLLFSSVRIFQQRGTGLHGGRASINLWSPRTEAGEFSFSEIWIEADNGDLSTRNVIEAGWMVYPGRYQDTRPRLFAFWTKDNYRTGCYDISCPGFVQTSRKFALGSPITPVSIYNGTSYDISVNIYKDKITENWWLELQGERIGYWPRTVITNFSDGATSVTWGGEIANSNPGGQHTPTQMGSGHFPSEGYGKESYFRNLQVVDSTDRLVDPDNLHAYITKPSCYDLSIMPKDPSYGTYFYYGGPGLSPQCQ